MPNHPITISWKQYSWFLSRIKNLKKKLFQKEKEIGILKAEVNNLRLCLSIKENAER